MIRHRMPCEGGDEQPGAISSNLKQSHLHLEGGDEQPGAISSNLKQSHLHLEGGDERPFGDGEVHQTLADPLGRHRVEWQLGRQV